MIINLVGFLPHHADLLFSFPVNLQSVWLVRHSGNRAEGCFLSVNCAV